MRVMQNPVAAIRAGRPRTRFTTAQPRRRERQLGLLRRAQVTAATLAAANLAGRPRDALRRAARTVAHAGGLSRSGGGGSLPLGRARDRTVSWTRRTPVGLRAVRLRRTAPWRG